MALNAASLYEIVEVLTAITILIKAVTSLAASLRKASDQLHKPKGA